MKKIFILLTILLLTTLETFAYAIKVYDQMGNRLGTYRKEGENYVLYDFYDKKVENPEDLIKNAPNQKTLTNLSQYFYDENMNPIGSYTSGLWSNYGGYYPPHRWGYRYVPYNYYRSMNNNYIVRPAAKSTILDYQKYPYPHKQNINIIRTGF